MNGKSKCKILKEIRCKIAQDNDIAFVTSECKYQGDCSGTCPKCEAEVRYLEEELRKRQRLGKTVAVAGIAATLVVATTGCDLPFVQTTAGDPAPPYSENELIDGEMVAPTGQVDVPLMGEEVPPEDTESTGDSQCQTELPDDAYMGDPLPE